MKEITRIDSKESPQIDMSKRRDLLSSFFSKLRSVLNPTANKEKRTDFSKVISRRDFIRLSIAVPALTFVACSRKDTSRQVIETPEVVSTLNPSIEKARSLAKEIGIDTTFAESNPEYMFSATKTIAQDPEFDTKLWRIFLDQEGNELGLALDTDGEAIPLRRTATGEVVSIQGLNFELTDTDMPQAIYEYVHPSGQQFTVVGYEKDTNQTLKMFITAHEDEIKSLLETIFSHSTAARNVLHLPDEGMPSQIFSFADTNDPAFELPPDHVPDPKTSGTTTLRFDTQTGVPTRADLYVSAGHIAHEANLLKLPYSAVFGGYLANEAYGIAIDTYRVQNGLAPLDKRYEAASTGAGWSTSMLMMNNEENVFFDQQTTAFIKELSVTIMGS